VAGCRRNFPNARFDFQMMKAMENAKCANESRGAKVLCKGRVSQRLSRDEAGIRSSPW
jgi:hypothetical protein